MSETLTAHPHRHLPGRVWTIVLAAALVVAAAVTIAVLAVAVRDSGQPETPAPAVDAPARPAADLSTAMCEPAPVVDVAC